MRIREHRNISFESQDCLGLRVPNCFSALLLWSAKRWIVAISTTIATAFIIALPTAVIHNPIFGRDVEVTPWSVPVVLITSIISGLILATYVKNDVGVYEENSIKIGGVGAFFSFLAVGCPVCNKIALVALGYTGALQYFAPVQPYMAALGIGLLMYALRKRLNGELMCSTRLISGDYKNEEK
jgi:hypothetical protein